MVIIDEAEPGFCLLSEFDAVFNWYGFVVPAVDNFNVVAVWCVVLYLVFRVGHVEGRAE